MKSYFTDANKYNKDIQQLRALNEFKVWFSGDSENLLRYYKRGEYLKDKQLSGQLDSSLMTKNFYMLAPVGNQFNVAGGYQLNNFSVLHRPLAKVISRTFAVLIAGQAPEVIVTAKNKQRTKDLQLTINDILDNNAFDAKMQLACEYESYSGAVAFKPIISEDVDTPLFQIYPRERFIINESFESILNSIVFIDYFNHEQDTYTLLSEYGRGYIRYKLIDKNSNEKPLSTIEELSDLHDIELYTADNQPYNKVLAVMQKNRGTGESDYKDQIDNFQAVDEAFSIMINLIRKSQPKRVISESVLVHGQDANGNAIYSMPDSYDSDVVVMWDNKREGSQEEVNELQPTPDIKNPIEAYRNTIDSALLDIASSVGLSSKTLSGVEDAGANASAEALGLRSNVDYRTRDLKIQSWRKSLIDLIKLMLTLNSLDGQTATDTYDDIDIQINFYDPANFQVGKPVLKQKLDTIKVAYDSGLIDLDGALQYIWSDTMSPEEIEILKVKLTLTNINKDNVESVESVEVDKEGQ